MGLIAVVLTLDGRELLERMLPTLAGQGADRVVVIDDGSTDGTADWLADDWPEVEVVVHDENRGVARSFNHAVEIARDFRYLALLNNDLELGPGYLDGLAAELDARPDAAAANGKMRNARDPALLDGAGDRLRWSSAVSRRGWREPDRGQYDEPAEVFSACGGAAVYRVAAFDDVGPFDEDFEAYLEDIDWGFRAQLRGWTARYVPHVEVLHVGGATTGRDARRFGRLQRRNQVMLVLKDYPARALARYGPAVVVHHLLWLAASVRDRMLLAHLGAWAEVVRTLPATLRKRRAIQRGRRVDHARLRAIVGR